MTGRQARLVVVILTAAAILSSERWLVCRCYAAGDDDDYEGNGDQRTKALSNPLVANSFYGKIRNMTHSFSKDTEKKLDYCIKDSDKDWNKAFNFSSDLTFVANCLKETNGTVPSLSPICVIWSDTFCSLYTVQNVKRSRNLRKRFTFTGVSELPVMFQIVAIGVIFSFQIKFESARRVMD